MRLSDLLHREVFDAAGRSLGKVQDLLVRQDERLLGGHVGPFTVEGFVVGGRQGIRLGFERGGAQGPWPLSALFRRLERRARFVPWTAVENTHLTDVGQPLRLRIPGDELGPPPAL